MARKFIGQTEIKGPEHSNVVVRWWEAIKAPFRDDETPWCAAYVGGVLEECGMTSTRSAAARSYLTWGKPLFTPAPGCIVVLSRPGSSWSGHVGFVVGEDQDGRLLVLGGNQGDAVSVAPFSKDRVLGYRWPDDEEFPKIALLPVYATNKATSRNEA